MNKNYFMYQLAIESLIKKKLPAFLEAKQVKAKYNL